MQRFSNHLMGVDQGDVQLFSDFEDDGPMWRGTGARARIVPVRFSARYRHPPVVHVSISLWDIDTKSSVRADIRAENITETGFDLVFRTWSDTRVARARGAWMSIGELPHADNWELY
ncbi:H-type lectin domain-containing protein [Chachezhania antarctica]|uniref:H-type lectin domain-containing protein n=1 Tax=Chachezhania antarctica TaxID=2340860 RepID=UPI000EB0A1A7|nr:H-type lectin domain-containing protein [Chachezhania antarctica]|tara:strand:+ start:913 stop:1263 length:351 start_codon:yes stop_codon:yes gene_type:complete